jgi:dolichol-phosphate mannosyltransferase
MRTVVLPTYNEREMLPVAVERILHVSAAENLGLSILVVDDNSPDGTGQLADEIAAQRPEVRVLHRASKEGLAKAYFAGFRRALDDGAELIFEVDADLSHDPKYLPAMVRLIEQGADVVLGSRYIKGGGTANWPLGRRLISRGGCLYAQVILGLPYRDLTGGFKCFRRRVLEALDFDRIGASGYGFQIETTYRAHQLGFRIVEMPYIFVDRAIGESKMSGGIVSEAMVMVWKLRFSRPPAKRPPSPV